MFGLCVAILFIRHHAKAVRKTIAASKTTLAKPHPASTASSTCEPKTKPAETSKAVQSIADAAFKTVNLPHDMVPSPTGSAPMVRMPLGYL